MVAEAGTYAAHGGGGGGGSGVRSRHHRRVLRASASGAAAAAATATTHAAHAPPAAASATTAAAAAAAATAPTATPATTTPLGLLDEDLHSAGGGTVVVSKDRERWQQGGRVLRSRRYRRPFDDHRHTKRLFTPEIKRFLKGWLVRRRDNPYPNRDEKKGLAVQTGLTYIQICNWFANWRRKLKNAGNEACQRTWGNLIKSYNTQAQGNVEQFSICSDDSIWEEEEEEVADLDSGPHPREDENIIQTCLTFTADATAMDHSYSALFRKDSSSSTGPHTTNDLAQCSQISSTTGDPTQETPPSKNTKVPSTSSSKYKSHMMEKYLRDIGTDEGGSTGSDSQEDSFRKMKRTNKEDCPPLLLSKWLESAAKYQPGQSYIAWSAKNVTWRSPSTATDKKRSRSWNISDTTNNTSAHWENEGHLREELDAAVALTCLSGLQH